MKSQSFECVVGGRNLVVEIGKLAGQANGAVTVRYGDTVVLVTACVAPEPREGTDFVPLTVDYEERLYAAGKIPGGFIRREGRPSQEATLASRLTDRPIRPLLPKTWRNEIQLIITVLSADQENNPDMLAVIGGSAALTVSEVPFEGPVASVRVGYINNELVLNPTLPQLETSQLELVVVSSSKAVVMTEGEAEEVSEDIVLRAIKFGHEANQEIIKLQEQLRQAYGKPKMEAPASGVNPEIASMIKPLIEGKLGELLSQREKSSREDALNALRKEVVQSLSEAFPEGDIIAAFESKVKAEIRNKILKGRQHVDGRALTEVRPITCEAGLLPRTHGSALFTRGQTQVLTITTLGSVGMKQRLDGLGIEESKRFMHHYNMPPFSSGEVKRIGTPGRREIGHGALAEKALIPVIPGDVDFPYTIRLVSEVLSSSGSTSMASVCASSLSLMDAGVPTKAAVAGVAMGLVTDEQGNYVVLTDIDGIEDFNGDMDFKVAGTRAGITALQMDIKLKGVSFEIIETALNNAKDARFHILDIMQQTLPANRSQLSQYAPRMYKITVPVDKIGTVIGPGGKTIRKIIEETKATVDIEDDGTVFIGAESEEAAAKAIQIIKGLTEEAEVGKMYTGKVTRILNFGAMVEILPGKEGLIHISELADYRVDKVEDIVKIGDEVTVKLIAVDDLGRLNLSRRAAFPPSEGKEAAPNTRPQGGSRPPYQERGNKPRFEERPRSGPPREGNRHPPGERQQ